VLAVQTAGAECERSRAGADLQPCEAERTGRGLLDAANMPRMSALNEDAIRFSSAPALGGEALIFEVRRNRGGDARATIMWFSGHPQRHWRREGRLVFVMSRPDYRRFAASVDAAIARVRTPNGREAEGDAPAFFICLDGPGYMTERVRGGEVVSLSGWCPYAENEEHPNSEIAIAVMRIVCRRIGGGLDPERRLARQCAAVRRIR
jgi:hypothetical protein